MMLTVVLEKHEDWEMCLPTVMLAYRAVFMKLLASLHSNSCLAERSGSQWMLCLEDPQITLLDIPIMSINYEFSSSLLGFHFNGELY